VRLELPSVAEHALDVLSESALLSQFIFHVIYPHLQFLFMSEHLPLIMCWQWNNKIQISDLFYTHLAPTNVQAVNTAAARMDWCNLKCCIFTHAFTTLAETYFLMIRVKCEVGWCVSPTFFLWDRDGYSWTN